MSPNCNFPSKCLMPNCNGDYRPKSSTRLFLFDNFYKTLVHLSHESYQNESLIEHTTCYHKHIYACERVKDGKLSIYHRLISGENSSSEEAGFQATFFFQNKQKTS